MALPALVHRPLAAAAVLDGDHGARGVRVIRGAVVGDVLALIDVVCHQSTVPATVSCRALGGKLDGAARPAPRFVSVPVGHALHRDLGAVQDDDPVDEADVEQGLNPTAADRPASSMLGARSTRRDIPARETSMSPPFRSVCGLMRTTRRPRSSQSKATVVSSWLLGLFIAPDLK